MTNDKPTAEELADTLDVIRKSISEIAHWPVSIIEIEAAADMLRSQAATIRERDAEIVKLKSLLMKHENNTINEPDRR